MMKTRILSIVALLLVAVTGAMAQTETLLTTITATAKEQASYSTANVATVSFSYTANGSSAYLANWGWWGYGFTATVTAAEGYTITKCVFYDDANRTATDSEAPFVVETTEEDKTPRINGTPIDGGNMWSKGIKKIEVYGYVTPAATYTVALADNTEDAANWQAKVGNAEEFSGLPLQGVAEDDSVTLAYNGTREVSRIEVVEKATPARPLAEATAEDLGKIVGANGNIYDTQLAASNAGTTAVAMIAYVGSTTGHTTYTHGLAIALSDEGSMVWSTAKSTCEGKTAITDAAWLLPSKDQWNTMFYANGGNNASCTGLNTAISNAGGTALVADIYWTASSTESQTGHWIAYISGKGDIDFYDDSDNNNDHVRAALAF